MDELVQWLREQFDEDEQIARAVEDRSAPWDGQWAADGDSAVRTVNGHVLFYRHDSGPLKPGLADYVAEHDPARVLREIDTKRRILYLAVQLPKVTASTDLFDNHRDAWAEVLKQLALPYADRPGYREEWRP